MTERASKVGGRMVTEPPLVIAGFYDLLGYRALVEQSQGDWSLALRKVRSIERLLRDQFTHHGEDVLIRVFSDNIYIAYPLLANGELRAENLFWFMSRLFDVQWWFIKKGFFLRGGISVGTQYASSLVIFGTALVRAYLAEREAKVPRVIVDGSFLEALDTFRHKLKDATVSNIKRLISRDTDGKWFVDYLMFLDDLDYSYKDRRQILLNHRRRILEQVRMHQEKGDVLQKYLWLARYHNAFAGSYDCTIDTARYFSLQLEE